MMKPADLLYLGLGAAFLAKDKFDGLLTDLEKRGDLSRQEIQSFVEEAQSRARKERDALAETVREQIKKTLTEMGVATKDDIAALRELIEKR